MGRLRTLDRLDLAEEREPGSWKLSPEMEPTLRRLGERDDISKALHREMAREGHMRDVAEYAIYDPTDRNVPPRLVGRVVGRGLSDEIQDQHYLIVDGIDGRTHWIDIGRGDATEPMPEGAMIAVSPRSIELRAAGRALFELASANQGHYFVDLHLRRDPTASHDFCRDACPAAGSRWGGREPVSSGSQMALEW